MNLKDLRERAWLIGLCVGVVLLTGCVSVPGGAVKYNPDNIYVEHDEFKGTTTVKMDEVLIKRDWGMTYSFNLYGPVDEDSARMMLQADAGTGSWNYLKCFDVAFLADGARIDPEDEEHDGSAQGEGVLEFIWVTLSADELRTLAYSEETRGRLCHTELMFTETNKKYMKEFLRQWEGSSGSSVEQAPGDAPSAEAKCYTWQSDYKECVKANEGQ